MKKLPYNQIYNFYRGIDYIDKNLPIIKSNPSLLRDINFKAAYYLYILINPITGKVFYVGKGCSDRADKHQKLAENRIASNNNYKLYKTIRTIIDDGKNVIHRKIYKSNKSQLIYFLEWYLIKRFKLGKLTNLIPGGTKEEKTYNKWLIQIREVYGKRKDKKKKINAPKLFIKKKNGEVKEIK